MVISKKNKKKHGVFYTTGSDIILNLDPFKKWWAENGLNNLFQNTNFCEDNKNKLLEPFAGNLDIIKSLIKLGFMQNDLTHFQSFDINPQNNVVIEDKNGKILKVKTIKQDVLKKFPKGFLVSITNPPYFAKNSATKQKINIDFKYDVVSDLYETCLIDLLKHCNYVGAIIPETFINSDLSIKKHLDCFISLIGNKEQDEVYFSDTEHPVCLALFSKKTKNIQVNKMYDNQNSCLNFDVYQNNLFLGKYSELIQKEKQFLINNTCRNSTYFLINRLVVDKEITKIVFNDPNGLINIQCLDNTKNSSIFMTMTNIVEPKDVKQSSRSKTRISLYNKKGELILDKDFLNQFCLAFNEKFNLYRQETHDLFLTSFRGLREDGYYRKRLDFKKIKMLLGL